jgi:hypothetical protein
MLNVVRSIAYGTFAGGVLALTIVAPQQIGVLAAAPVEAAVKTVGDLFPPSVNPRMFRKYDIIFDDSVSTDVTRTQIVKKIGHGRTSEVTIVTTPSGTYSTDGIVSPNVRYPGIETTLKPWDEDGHSRSWFSYRSTVRGAWISFSNGSFTYLSYVAASARS